MTATYVGCKYMAWEIDGKKGTFTDVYVVKPFHRSEENVVGDKAVAERVRGVDLRKELKDIAPGSPVNLVYDSGPNGKALLVEIVPV